MRENKRVLLAFSGGIDSCAAVEILRGEGYCVEALTIDMLGDEALMAQATTSAERLGVTLHIVDAREIFEREIIGDFTSEYLRGYTPAPCTRCNTVIKWELLAQKADELGIYHIATGHYFKIEQRAGYHYVARAADPVKDQSYYLWGVRQDILARALTPMGDRIKSEVKSQSVIKRESMGICFLRGSHYAEFLCKRCGEFESGDIVLPSGEVVGAHNGIARYTLGQRRGEGIPAGMRVVGVDAVRNQIVVGDNELLYTRKIVIERCCFVDSDEVENSAVEVMVRGVGRNPEGSARVTIEGNDRATVELSNPAWAVALGQPVVLYIGRRVVGGGYVAL